MRPDEERGEVVEQIRDALGEMVKHVTTAC